MQDMSSAAKTHFVQFFPKWLTFEMKNNEVADDVLKCMALSACAGNAAARIDSFIVMAKTVQIKKLVLKMQIKVK